MMRLRDPNSINANIYLPWRKVGPISQLGLPQLFNSVTSDNVTKQKGQCHEIFDLSDLRTFFLFACLQYIYGAQTDIFMIKMGRKTLDTVPLWLI